MSRPWQGRLGAGRALAWLGERLDLGPWLERARERQVPAVTQWPQLIWRSLGLLGLFLLLMQAATGLAMLPFYRPDPAQALASLLDMEQSLPLGFLTRRLHAIGGHLLLILSLLHAMRTLTQGAYQKPRELHWLGGMLLLWCVMAMLFSGGLLPAGRAAQAQLTALWPGMDQGLGPRGMGRALGWALAAHLGLPLIMMALVWLHLALARRTGPMPLPEPQPQSQPLDPLFPLGLINQGLALAGCLLFLLALAVFCPQPFLPAGLPWFLWAPGLLPGGWGLALTGLFSLGVALLPFWDRVPARPFWSRPWASKLIALALAAWFLLSLLGAWRS